jgi:C3HC4-type zinc finger (RING finger) protein
MGYYRSASFGSICLQVSVVFGILFTIVLVGIAIATNVKTNTAYMIMAALGLMFIVATIAFGCYVIVDFCQKRRNSPDAESGLLNGLSESIVDVSELEYDMTTDSNLGSNSNIDHSSVYYDGQSEDQEGLCQACYRYGHNITLKCGHKLCSSCTANMVDLCPSCRAPILSGVLVI